MVRKIDAISTWGSKRPGQRGKLPRHIKGLGDDIVSRVNHGNRFNGATDLGQVITWDGESLSAAETFRGRLGNLLRCRKNESEEEGFRKKAGLIARNLGSGRALSDIIDSHLSTDSLRVNDASKVLANGILAFTERAFRKVREGGSGSPEEQQRNIERAELLMLMLDTVRQSEYRFEDKERITRRQQPYQFARQLMTRRNLVRGEILELGVGPVGADMRHFSSSRQVSGLHLVDSSKMVLESIGAHFEAKPRGQKGPAQVHLPEHPIDMLSFLEEAVRSGQKFDLIYSHSTFHYFDDIDFRTLIGLVSKVLNPSGHLAFAIKAPGAHYQSDGLVIYRETGQTVQGTVRRHSVLQKNGNINTDHQLRIFRDRMMLMDLIAQGADDLHLVLDQADYQIEDYESDGQGAQKFYKFVYQKREN